MIDGNEVAASPGQPTGETGARASGQDRERVRRAGRNETARPASGL